MLGNQQEDQVNQVLENFVTQLQSSNQASNPQLVVKEVLELTGGQPNLIEKLCNSILESKITIPSEKESLFVEEIMRKTLRDNLLKEDQEKKGSVPPNKMRTIPDYKNWLILVARLVIVLVAILMGRNFWLSWRSQPCPTGAEKINGSCVPKNNSDSPPSSIYYSTFKDVPNVPKGRFDYGGSTTFAPLRKPEAEAPQGLTATINKVHPQFDLVYFDPSFGSEPGSGTGIRGVLEEQLNFAESSRPLKKEEFEEAKIKGFELVQRAVAIDGIAIFVHPTLPIQGLTIPELRSIFNGKITNWRDLGGPNLEITCFIRNPEAGGTPKFFQNKILLGEKYGNCQILPNPTPIIQQVKNTPGSISFGSAPEVVKYTWIKTLALDEVSSFSGNNIKKPNLEAFANRSYPITRKLFVVIKRDGRIDEQAGVAYTNLLLSDEGQKLIQEAGFAPIRPIK